jgi:hypothetical protein
MNGGDIEELKQYGYTECNTSVNIYWQKTTGKCFLFADTSMAIYNSLEIWHERKNSTKKTKCTILANKGCIHYYAEDLPST